MWELDSEESWAPKNWCFWTVVLEKTLESPLDYKEIQPVHPKGNQSWIFIGKTDAEAELQYFGHLMRRTDSLEKTLMLEKIEGRRRRGRQRMRYGIIDWKDMSLSKLWEMWRTGKPGVLQSMGSQRVTHNWATEQQHNCIQKSNACLKEKLCVFEHHYVCVCVCLIVRQTSHPVFQGTSFLLQRKTDWETLIKLEHILADIFFKMK